LAQLCQDQKRKEFEKQNEINEIQKVIRTKNDSIEDYKAKVREAAEKENIIERTKRDKVRKNVLHQFLYTKFF